MLLIGMLLAQASVAQPSAEAAGPRVVSYPPAFFAAQQPTSALDMLLQTPGFALDIGAAVRGYEGAAGNVLIDGQRPASKTDNLEEILRRLPAAQVARIDVIRGGVPGVDMQGKTVVANVIRKQVASRRGLVSLANSHVYDGRNAGTVRAEASADLGNGRKFELSGRAGKGIDDRLGDGPGLRISDKGLKVVRTQVDTEADTLSAVGAAVFETPFAGGQARANLRVNEAKYKASETAVILAPDEGLERSDGNSRFRQSEVGARFSRRLGAKVTLEAVALRQDGARDVVSRFDDGVESAFFLRLRTSETISRAAVTYRPAANFSAESGAEVTVNHLRSATRVTFDGAEVVVPAANVRVEEVRGEAFAKVSWTASPAVTIEANVRYEQSRVTSTGDVLLERTLRYVKPRLAVAWQAAPQTQLRLLFEREVGQLNFDDLVASASFADRVGILAGNPRINPQQAWRLEAALEQRFWRDGVITGTYRYFRLQDVVDRGPVFTPFGVFDTPRNIGSGTKREISLDVTAPLARLGLTGAQIKANVTYRRSRVTDPTTRDSREISNLHPVDWGASYRHDIAAWSASYGVDAYGGWRETAYRFNSVSVVKLKSFVTPFVEFRPRPDINLRFEVQNATSRGLHLTLYNYTPVRAAGAAPAATLDRNLQFGRMYYFRATKTFGR